MRIFVPTLFVLSVLFVMAPSHAIKKCRDADGKMHYGDTAIEECENSKITTLTDRGFIKEEDEAPKTQEQLRLEQEEQELLEKQRAEALAAEEEKQRILSIYETEADIDRQRDNQVRSVQSNIDVHKSYLSNMQKRVDRYEQQMQQTDNTKLKEQFAKNIEDSKARMAEYTDQLNELEEQRKDIIDRFTQEKETYLALKNGQD